MFCEIRVVVSIIADVFHLRCTFQGGAGQGGRLKVKLDRGKEQKATGKMVLDGNEKLGPGSSGADFGRRIEAEQLRNLPAVRVVLEAPAADLCNNG